MCLQASAGNAQGSCYVGCVSVRRWGRIRYKRILFYIIIALFVAAAAAFLLVYRVKILKILSPFLLTIPVVYIIKPLVNKLTAHKVPISAAILIIYGVFIAAIVVVCIFFIPSLVNNIRDLSDTLPELLTEYQKLFDNALSSIKYSRLSDDVKILILDKIEAGINTAQVSISGIMESSINTAMSMLKVFFDFTVAMVIAYYAIKDECKFKQFSYSMLPFRGRKRIAVIFKEINIVLRGFIQGQLVTSLIVGLLETIGLIIVGVKYPLALGMIGGLCNIIPYFGPYISAVPALAIALTDSPMKALWTIVTFVVIQQIDNSYISPRIIEGKLGLHPVATIFAVLAGGEFFGIAGMLLAVPAIAILRIIINRSLEAIA